jgi:hypothetical protein
MYEHKETLQETYLAAPAICQYRHSLAVVPRIHPQPNFLTIFLLTEAFSLLTFREHATGYTINCNM